MVSTGHVAVEKGTSLILLSPSGALLAHSKGLASCPDPTLRGSPAQFNLPFRLLVMRQHTCEQAP